MMGDIVINELLCSLHNKFGVVPVDKIQVCIFGFYDESEVSIAKQLLFEIANKCLDDTKMPRLIMRKGVNKGRLDCEDIISLYSLLDKEKVVLPKLVSVNLGRIPPVQPSEVDVVNICRGMDDLKASLKLLRDELVELKIRIKDSDIMPNGDSSNACSLNHPLSVKLPPIAGSQKMQNFNKSTDVAEQLRVSLNSHKPSYSQVAQKGRVSDEDQDGWVDQRRRRKSKLKPIYGDRKIVTEAAKLVAAVPDRRWRLYVGNIKAGTSECDIVEYCTDQGVKVVKAEIISSQDVDDPEKPVAMCVEFCFDDKDKVMASNFWPQGMKIRGWFLKKKKSWSW
jgi:hypothetical protein